MKKLDMKLQSKRTLALALTGALALSNISAFADPLEYQLTSLEAQQLSQEQSASTSQLKVHYRGLSVDGTALAIEAKDLKPEDAGVYDAQITLAYGDKEILYQTKFNLEAHMIEPNLPLNFELDLTKNLIANNSPLSLAPGKLYNVNFIREGKRAGSIMFAVMGNPNIIPQHYQETKYIEKGTKVTDFDLILPRSLEGKTFEAQLVQMHKSYAHNQPLGLAVKGRVSNQHAQFSMDTSNLEEGMYTVLLKDESGATAPFASAVFVANPSRNYVRDIDASVNYHKGIDDVVFNFMLEMATDSKAVQSLDPKLIEVNMSFDNGPVQVIKASTLAEKSSSFTSEFLSEDQATIGLSFPGAFISMPSEYETLKYYITYNGQPLYDGFNPDQTYGKEDEPLVIKKDTLVKFSGVGYVNADSTVNTIDGVDIIQKSVKGQTNSNFFMLKVTDPYTDQILLKIPINESINFSASDFRHLDLNKRYNLELFDGATDQPIPKTQQINIMIGTGINFYKNSPTTFLTSSDLSNNIPLYDLLCANTKQPVLSREIGQLINVLNFNSAPLSPVNQDLLRSLTTLEGLDHYAPKLMLLSITNANKLQSPKGIEGLTNLISLQLSNNGLTSLPDLRGLKNLVMTNTSQVNFEGNAIPKEFFSAEYLPEKLLSDAQWLKRNIDSQLTASKLVPDSYYFFEDSGEKALDIFVNDTLVKDSAFVLKTEGIPQGTQVQLKDGKVQFKAPENFNGIVKFSYAADGAETDVLVHILPVNDAPTLTLVPDVVVQEGNKLTLKIAAMDVDNLPSQLKFSLVSPSSSAFGTASITPEGTFEYQAKLGVSGPDQVKIRVTDEGGLFSEITINVKVKLKEAVTPPVTPPVAPPVIPPYTPPYNPPVNDSSTTPQLTPAQSTPPQTTPAADPVVIAEPAVPQGQLNFTDLGPFQWAQKAIASLASKGIFKGKAEGKFDPSGSITRAEFAAITVRLLKLSPVPGETAKLVFTDVRASDWYQGDVAMAVAAGLLKGDGKKFNPNGLMTRQEMATILGRILELKKVTLRSSSDPLAAFKDADLIADWAKAYARLAVQEGIITGESGKFKPQAPATRAEAAVMIDRLEGIKK